METINFDPQNYRKHSKKNKELIKKSLLECGAGRAIVADKEGNLIAGNGTYAVAKKLNMPVKVVKTDGKELIVVQRTDLGSNDEKRRKLAILDNSTSDSSNFDLNKLKSDFAPSALKDLGIDLKGLDDVGEELKENFLTEEPQIEKYDENVFFPSKNDFDIPVLREDRIYTGSIDDVCFGKDDNLDKNKTYLVIFGNCNISMKAPNQVIGFFVDDYRFEQVWANAVKVLKDFKKIKPKALMAPNFSLWVDEPLPFQIMAWYKTQWCARFWQEAGFDIIPTLNWGGERSYQFCFLGIPKGCPLVAVQCRNIRTKQEKSRFLQGLLKAKEVIDFKRCIVYGKGIMSFADDLKKANIDFVSIRSWSDKKAQIKKELEV